MFARVIRFGLIAGLIVGAMLFGITVALKGQPPPAWGMALGFTSMLIALSAVFIGVKQHRDHALGGVIRFRPAFGMGLAISLVASICYVLAWELTLAVTQIDFGGEYANMLIAKQKAAGVSGEALVKLVAEMEVFKANYAKPLYRLPMTFLEIFPVGALVSLVTAALVRNTRFMAVKR